jgi:hypothetical protein
MKKIIITIPQTKLIIDAMSLAIITARMKEVITEQLILKKLRESISICLN